MKRSTLRWEALAGLAFALAGSACGQILGLGDFEDGPADGADGAATSGTGGSSSVTTGTGGHGGASTSSQGGGGSTASQGGGGSSGCADASQCPGDDTECQTRTCTGGVCGFAFEDNGKVTTNQLLGDCIVNVCDGAGAEIPRSDDADVSKDGKACTDDICVDGVAKNPPLAEATACQEGGGSVCDGMGACVQCNIGDDCASHVCQQFQCVAGSCIDGVTNAGETDVDCGGGCGPCDDNLSCGGNGDCKSHVCTAGKCAVPTCADNAQNGGESDTDCGSVCPNKCLAGDGCSANSDCIGGFCTGSTCAPTCIDGVKNGTETDTDCGGPGCLDCVDGQTCAAGGDCTNGVCIGNVCKAPTCSDGVKNGAETGSDCGGGACPKCGNGVPCIDSTDCTSSVCTGGTCQAPACGDGVKNGGETDTDCGGPVCSKCPNGDACAAAGDCVSNFCLANVCQGAQCNDGFKNGTETDVDCGGSACPACGNNRMCNTGTDCTSLVCVGGLCKAPTCIDGVKNGSETGTDCGGGAASGCAGCADNAPCAANADCSGALCNSGLCCTPQTPAATCSGLCGTVTNNCAQAVACPGCTAPDTCGGAGVVSHCGCTLPCPVWNRVMGDGVIQGVGQVIADSSGNVIVVGQFSGTVDFGGGALTSAGNHDVFVAKYTKDGVYTWAKRFGDLNVQFGNSVAVDSSGNIIIAGQFTGTLDFGGAFSITSAGGYDAFVAKLDSSGNVVWTLRGGDASTQLVASVVVDNAGQIVLTGSNGGTLDFSGGQVGGSITSAGGNDIFVAKLKANGTFVWARGFGDASAQTGQHVAVDSQNDIYVTGDMAGSITVGINTLTSAGGTDVLVAKLGGVAGVPVWAARYGDAGNQTGYGIDTTSTDDIIVTGVFTGAIDLGSGSVTSAGSYDTFVARFKGNNNTLQWSKTFGGASSDFARNLVVDADDNVVVSGDTTGTVDFGGGALANAGSNDVFLFKLKGSSGNHMWSRLYGDSDQQLGISVGVDTSNNVLAAGTVKGAIDFGLGSKTSAGAQDIYLVKLLP